MKVSSRGTSLAQATLRHQETTRKHIMSSRQPRRRKSFRDTEMSSTANFENVKRKSKPWLTPWIIWRWGIKTTVTNSSKVLKELTWRRSRSWKINVEQHQKLYSRNEESSKSCRKIMMTTHVNWWKSERSHRLFKSKTKQLRWKKKGSTRILTPNMRRFSEPSSHFRPLSTT